MPAWPLGNGPEESGPMDGAGDQNGPQTKGEPETEGSRPEVRDKDPGPRDPRNPDKRTTSDVLNL